jgi:integrase
MPRTVQDAKLENPTLRQKLKLGKDHFKTITPAELHIGWRRRKASEAGVWLVRTYIGKTGASQYSQYKIAKLGWADDLPGGLTYAEALKLAQAPAVAALAVKAEELTVGEAMSAYVKWLHAHKATGSDAELRAAKLILPQLGSIKVTALTTHQLSEWFEALAVAPPLLRTKAGNKQQWGVAPTTAEEKRARRASANRVLSTLKAALNMAFHKGRVSDDVAWRRVMPFPQVDAARPGYLSTEEAQRLINASDAASGFRALVIAALSTGARYGELIAMRNSDFQRGKIHIPTSKSGKPRDIVLTEEGNAFFESMTIGRPPDALIFVRADGGGWASSHQARPMADACRHAHIDPPVGFHALRHTVASLAVMNGTPLMVVARNLGHASTVMIEKHYGHLAQSYIDDQIRLGAPRFGVSEPTNVIPLLKTKDQK